MGSNLAGRTSNTACSRCRQKKKKCDQKLPKCRLCEVAGADCYAFDPVTKRPVRRSHVHDLEQRVASLQAKVRHLEQSQNSQSAHLHPPHAEPTAPGQASPVSNRLPPLRPALRDPGSHGFAVRTDQVDACILSLGPISLPPSEAARGLFDAYFQFANLCMPLLHEGTFEQNVKLLYSLPRVIDLAESHGSSEARTAVFFVFEVMAIGLLLKHKKEPLTSPLHLAQQYHEIAAAALGTAGASLTLEGVQGLVLSAQWLYHHPNFEGVWSAVGAALRSAVEIGLHQEPISDGKVDALTADTMRRTFWVAYMLDRNVSRSLSKPMFLPDSAITVKFPSVTRDEFITADGIEVAEANTSASKLVALHLLRFRLIQSEMQSVLYDRPPPPYKPIRLHVWQQEMRRRLDGWYNSVPCRRGATGTEQTVVETFELTYKAALVDLYRSTPNMSTLYDSQHLEAAEAAAQVIRLYRYFFKGHKLTIYWLSSQCLYTAAEALLSAYVQTAVVRDRLSIGELQTLVQTCSSTLWGLTEHFPAGAEKRDAFDALSAEKLAEVSGRYGPHASLSIGRQVHQDLSTNVNVPGRTFNGADVDYGPSSVQAGPTTALPSLSSSEPLNSQLVPDLTASGNEARVQAQGDLQDPWDNSTMPQIFDFDPAWARYDNADDLSALWGGADGMDSTFTSTWI